MAGEETIGGPVTPAQVRLGLSVAIFSSLSLFCILQL